MSLCIRNLVHAMIVFGTLLLPLSPAAALEGFAVYEDWHEGIIRSSRWQGGESFGGQEVGREVTAANTLELRYRHQGSTGSNTGNSLTEEFLHTANPTPITGIAATFTVSSLSMTTCAANNSGTATRARPARLLMAKFNDGTQSVPGNRTGDYLALVEARRDGSSANPNGILNVAGFIIRCTNASCSTSNTVFSNVLPTTVSVGQSFTLRLLWDQPNRRFLFGLDDAADVAMPYTASDTAVANNVFVTIDVAHSTANCTAGAVVIDSTTQVGTVQTKVPTPHDFNGNGTADILWRHTSGQVYQWLLSGTTVIGTGSPGAAGPDWTIVGVGDFNGDGTADILWQHTSGAVYIWLLNGTTVIDTGSPGGAGPDWTIAGVGDFNGDGTADILWRHTSGAVYIWLMDGPNVIGSGSPGATGSDWTIAGVGDFNGDGTADILWRHTSGLVYEWLLNGTSIIGSGSPGATGSDWTIAGVGDFNGDGKADILWRHTSGVVYQWLLNGTSIIDSGSPGAAGNDWTIVGVGDFDGDRKADILWRHTSGVVYEWLLNGASIIGTGSPGAAGSDWKIQ